MPVGTLRVLNLNGTINDSPVSTLLVGALSETPDRHGGAS